MSTLFYNAEIVNEGSIRHGYIIVEDEMISRVGEGEPSPAEIGGAEKKIDVGGRYLLPGAIDTHVHFREPGLTHKASIATESAAAVSGGVTSFIDMPNTRPATTSMGAVADKKRIAEESSYANYGFFIGATNDNLDELLAADPHEVPGVKVFMGSSTGNMLVDDDFTLSQLFANYHGIIAVHAEDEATLAEARRQLIAKHGEEMPVSMHSLARPAEACYKASKRAVDLAAKYNARLHLLHISTARELSLLKAGDPEAKRITAETCPHYLLFNEGELITPGGYMLKCNPAIKSEDDRAALVKGVASGLIDTIATDHAPHLLEEKQGTLLKAASGMPGVRFMLPEMLTLSDSTDNDITMEKVVELTAHNPALIYGIDRRGFLRRGYYADFVIVERTEPYTPEIGEYLRPGMMSPCNWTPYSRTAVNYRIASTYLNGRLAFDGTAVRQVAPRPLRFNTNL